MGIEIRDHMACEIGKSAQLYFGLTGSNTYDDTHLTSNICLSIFRLERYRHQLSGGVTILEQSSEKNNQ